MSDWLEEIEARRIRAQFDTELHAWTHAATEALLNDDIPWLIARVRELEAQAAVNNAAENVVVQASILTPWQWRHVAQRLWAKRGSSKETTAMTALAIALEFYETKRAALAAREGE